MKTSKLFKNASFLMICAMTLITSCNDEERITAADTKDLTEEALTDFYYQDMDDMAGVAIGSPDEHDFNGGRVASVFTFKIRDNRFVCNGDSLIATFERLDGSTKEIPKGMITIDFGTGCTDARGNTRSGKVVFTFSGRRFMPGSTVVITGEDYTINDVKLEGTRTVTNISASTAEAPEFNVTLVGGKATFEDGTFATRESDITSEWIRESNPLEDKLVIGQASTASGTTRSGRDYEVTLLEPLEYKRFCGIAVSGIKKFVIDGEKEITTDYGEGECDRSVTISVNGLTREIQVN